MKKKIHPNYEDVLVKCACGAEIKTRSTKKITKTDICSSCHPFFTGGQQRLMDTEGRIESFKKRYAKHYQKKENK